MDPMPQKLKNSRRLSYIGKGAGIVFVLCFLAATLIYYLPGLPTSPRPETGNIYPVRNHYTILYWNGKEIWADRILTYMGIVFFGIACFIGSRVQDFLTVRNNANLPSPD
jgi:hypothetical protein